MRITVAIPSIPPRGGRLTGAVASVLKQTLPAAALSIALDTDHEGAPRTRQRALGAVQTDWVAFLDDDDFLLPEHLQVLADTARETGADYVYSYFYLQQMGGPLTEQDPLAHFGRPFDPARPHQTTVTTLVRTELAKQVGFRQPPEGALIDGQRYGEDFLFTVECAAAGAKVVHVPQRTWVWCHWEGNTSGDPSRWG